MITAPGELRERPHAWGISWCANRHDDVSWIQHSGGLPGFTTSVCFDPRQQVGAIVLHNGTGFTAEVARELAVTACRLAEPALPTVAVPSPAPVQYRPLLGLYARAGLGGGMLSLQWRAGELAFLIPEIPSWQLTLEPTSDTDVFVAGPGSDLAGENVIFRRRDDGHVTSVLLVQATYLRQDHDSRTGRSDQPLCAAHYRSGLARIRRSVTHGRERLSRCVAVGMLRPECGICLPQIRYGTDNGLERIMEAPSDCGCSKRRVSCRGPGVSASVPAESGLQSWASGITAHGVGGGRRSGRRAGVRLAGADRLRFAKAWAVPLLSFTPQVTAGAWISTLLLRGAGPAAVAAAAGAALAVAVGPRAVPYGQPPAAGPVLRVLTANLLVGRALAEAVVDLTCRKRPDALFVQELTDDAEAGLQQAGLGDLLPYRVTQPAPYGTRGSIYARYPLRGGSVAVPPSAARCTARLDLPSGQFVHLACIHAAPPKPPWFPGATARWRSQLSALPAPGDSPLILAGDFNATVDHAQFRRLLRRGYADAASQAGNGLSPTWGPQPGRRPALLAIDHVLTDRRCAVLSTSAHLLPGSDHRALYAELRLPAPHSREDQTPQATR